MTSVGAPPDDRRDRLFDDEQSAFTSPAQGMAFDTDPFAFLSSIHPSASASSSSASSTQDDSSQAPSPPDWSEFSNLWDPLPAQPGLDLDFDEVVMPSDNSNIKHEAPVHNFPFAPMDLDFDPSALGIDPSALHFDPNKLFTTPSFFAPAFPIDNNANQGIEAQLLSVGPGIRRLSVTSSSSSSGASLSPVQEHSSSFTGPSTMAPDMGNLQMHMLNMVGGHATASGAVSPITSDPASELAQRVRQAAGVTLAVPIQGQQNSVAQKLPIPRLPRPTPTATNSIQQSSPSSTASSPQSSATSPTSSSAPSVAGSTSAAHLAPAVRNVPGARPKTSHTTIERRYRTNLNARIQSLKDAVPALRVLERKKGAKTAKEGEEGIKEETAKENVWGDVVDERGYVDGVKVARKVSKANVLGKATEYIHVLKRREARLKREQEGLRSLVGGLVGGPALLREWETAWIARFGGPERDELDHEAAGDDEDDEDDEDDDDDDSRARKRPKVTKESGAKGKKDKKPSGGATAASTGGVPEKRKRGRPRKVVPTTNDSGSFEGQAPDAFPQTQMQQSVPPLPVVPQSQPATQYLLAAFAFFSLFKSPLTSYPYNPTSSPHAHAHSGSVLSSTPVSSASVGGFGWRELVDVFHIIISGLVLLSIVLPWLPSSFRITRFSRPFPLSTSLTLRRPSTSKSKTACPSAPKMARKSSDTFNRVALLDALAPDARGTPDEAAQLRSALGIYPGLLGLALRVMGKVLRGSRATHGIERLQLEQRAWVRLGEVVALDGKTSFGARVQAYLGMLAHTSAFSACATDLATLALIVHPLASFKADALWERASRARLVRPYEQRVLNGMTAAQAAAKLADLRSTSSSSSPSSSAWNKFASMSPLVVLGMLSVREDVRAHAGKLFVRAVAGADAEIRMEREVQREDEARAACVAAGRSLGGRTVELVAALERVAQGDEVLNLSEAEPEGAEEALLNALVLFRRLFPSSLGVSPGGMRVLLSPPPSPSKKNAGMRALLRRALGSEVFEVRGRGESDSESESEGEDEGRKVRAKVTREVQVEEWEVELEDARDRVVDMLVEADRVERRGRF